MSGQKKSNYELAGGTATPPSPWCYWVVENRLLAGAYPGSPDPEEHRSKIQALLDAGVRTFINLMEQDETNYQGRPFVPYEELVRQVCPKADCHRFAIRDLSVPTPALMTDILDTIDQSLAAGEPTYVHCWGGVGRTGTVVGCWILRHGLAQPASVLGVLIRLRQQDQERGQRMSPETGEQQRFVRQWSERGSIP